MKKTLELTVYISLSVADTKTVLTKSIASNSESGVTASCKSKKINKIKMQRKAKVQ